MRHNIDFETIFVWPDGTWVFKEDYCDDRDRWRGDDFHIMHIEGSPTDDEITEHIEKLGFTPLKAETLTKLLEGFEK